MLAHKYIMRQFVLIGQLKKKNILVNDEEADFIQDHSNRDKDHYSGVLQWGREIELNVGYSVGKWDFIVKEQCGVSALKITKGKHQR